MNVLELVRSHIVSIHNEDLVVLLDKLAQLSSSQPWPISVPLMIITKKGQASEKQSFKSNLQN